MRELKAGGLALVVASRFPENLGKVVRIARYVGFEEIYKSVAWEVIALSDLTGTNAPIMEGDYCIAPEKALMPIDGDDFSGERLLEKELSHA
ncbi:hypothetical protein [Enterobacter hormaechei]|uniref:hypothetical protein n=1 Tax=Enterobacter hormaechei TaxID=158836 RepID=UPI000F682634|nr:hypothetical protein [Enterobacter hormaechei]ELF1030709.1 hypothetical protein [Enterobacter kobei]MBN4764751.1 hypothetical protein [Enterobacter hormaechei]MCO7368096.1 hypothetical protein [Enterobacter hormaechei]MDV5636806.1 hypothetical protein [Enterobacter hormaechei]QXR29716.1 hypothetical protein EGK38_011585 [Enterobacter hormaechei]